MLKTLSIKNIALIDSATIEFDEGINVLSGETGAGKSVILEALNFVLGAKADKTLVRSGESECFVKAIFDVSGIDGIKEVFDNNDVDYDDELIISRKFNVDGKGSIKINGNTVTATMLKKFTALLVDVHGQSEHFRLLSETNQLKLIDSFGDKNFLNIKSELNTDYTDFINVSKEIQSLGGDENQRLIRLDILNYQIKEIESADIKAGEEEELLDAKQKLSAQERIVNSLGAVKEYFTAENGVSDLIGCSIKQLSSITNLSVEYQDLFDRLNNVFSEIDDISECASDYIDGLESLELNIDDIENRLDVIKSIKKKYGSTINEVSEFLLKAKNERDLLDNFNENAEKLLIKSEKLKKKLYDNYVKLSNERKNICQKFTNSVKSELIELGMPKSNFEIRFKDLPSFDECSFNSSNGFDKIEFLFTANLGEPLKPLSSVISGGEMSRFMLAIKAQSAKQSEVSTFIFDEIDAGISGNVAKVVSEKFAKISKDSQIIAISHLPQISAMADNNLFIIKTETDEKTVTTVKTLDADSKIKEIVRLVGGSDDDHSAVTLAKTLINNAKEYKNNLKG